MVTTKAACPWCGRQVALRKDGTFKDHDKNGARYITNPCEGGRKEPGPPQRDVEVEAKREELRDVQAVVVPDCHECGVQGASVIFDDMDEVWRCPDCAREKGQHVRGEQQTLSGEPASEGNGVAALGKVSLSVRFEAAHFGLSLSLVKVKALRAGNKGAALDVVRKKVKALPDAEDIPKGEKKRQTEALVAKVLTMDLDATVRAALKEAGAS